MVYHLHRKRDVGLVNNVFDPTHARSVLGLLERLIVVLVAVIARVAVFKDVREEEALRSACRRQLVINDLGSDLPVCASNADRPHIAIALRKRNDLVCGEHCSDGRWDLRRQNEVQDASELIQKLSSTCIQVSARASQGLQMIETQFIWICVWDSFG